MIRPLKNALIKSSPAPCPRSYIEIDQQINYLRKKWINAFSVLEPLYLIFYWDNKKSLDDYTLSQKRFDVLKSFYVDLFESFCRISVIAATIEKELINDKDIKYRILGPVRKY